MPVTDPVTSLAPLLHFDAAEPFLPELAAVSVFSHPAPSPSFPGRVEPRGDIAIEYALWWPCEIGHVYELEHVWVHGRRDAERWTMTAVEGSAHGGRSTITAETASGRPVVYLEPGKHGTASSPERFVLPPDVIEWLCGSGAGREGVCVTELFAGALAPTPVHHRQARRFLEPFAFAPTWRFDNVVDVADLPHLDFEHLATSVPDQVLGQLEGVPTQPLGRLAGSLADTTAVAVVSLTASDGALTADGVALDVVLKRIRAQQRELVIRLGPLPPLALAELITTLRRNWCFTATSLVCHDDAQLAAARVADVTAIIDRRYRPLDPDDDWVCLRLAGAQDFAHHRVMGPGGDIDYIV